MIDRYALAQLPREKALKVKLGPAREGLCVINGCPVDQHSYAVNLPQRAGLACADCAAEHGFELDWSTA